MTIDRIVLAWAGIMVLASVLLSVLHSPYWLFLTVFVGVNLVQSSVTGFCPLVFVLKKVGIRPGPAFQ